MNIFSNFPLKKKIEKEKKLKRKKKKYFLLLKIPPFSWNLLFFKIKI
jgi:ABC-type polysaccharide transport system permease subunit